MQWLTTLGKLTVITCLVAALVAIAVTAFVLWPTWLGLLISAMELYLLSAMYGHQRHQTSRDERKMPGIGHDRYNKVMRIFPR